MRKRKKEEVIIKSAEKVFAKKGFNQTRVSDIVKVAKIARGTFYLYFKSKEELFEKLLNELMNRIVSNFASIDYHNLNTIDDFFKHIEKVSNKFNDLVVENKELASLFLREITSSGGPFRDKLEVYHRGLMEISKEFLNFCYKCGLIREVNTEVVSYAASGMITALLSRFLDSSISASSEDIIKEGVMLYVYGLAKR